MKSFRSLLAANASEICELSSTQLSALEAHDNLLQIWNRRMNLTTVRKLEDVVLRHYCESLFLASRLPRQALTLADIGSGPGFPGLPIAVARPEYQVSLVESSAKKCVFLREACRHVPNVAVIESRSEALDHRFDWLVSRGVNWRRSASLLPNLCDHVALLLGEPDVDSISQFSGFKWQAPVKLPWGERRVILFGAASRA